MLGVNVVGVSNHGKSLVMRLFEHDNRFISHLYPILYDRQIGSTVRLMGDRHHRNEYGLTLTEISKLSKYEKFTQISEDDPEEFGFNFVNFVLLKKFNANVIFFTDINSNQHYNVLPINDIEIKTICVVRDNLVSLFFDVMEYFDKFNYTYDDVYSFVTGGNVKNISNEEILMKKYNSDYIIKYEDLMDNHQKITNDLYELFGVSIQEDSMKDHLFYNKYTSSYDYTSVKNGCYDWVFDICRECLIKYKINFDEGLSYEDIISLPRP